MQQIVEWPRQVFDSVQAHLGMGFAVEPLGGMSGSSVQRAKSTSGSLIVKRGRAPVESWFYRQVAPTVREAGVAVPELLLAVHDGGTHWLVLEDVPERLPYGRPPEPLVVDMLARLHACTRRLALDPALGATHGWTDQQTTAALACFPAATVRALRSDVTRLQARATPLYAPWCWISGDPNPLNWGMCSDGTAVLYDWERFGLGTPALDLAITIPGLGHADDFARTAAAYHAIWRIFSAEPLPWDPVVLAEGMAIAKVAAVVALLAEHVAGTARVDDALVTWLRETVPAWVREVATISAAAP